MIDSQHVTQVKKAELLSSLGAGILGAGIGLLLANILGGYVMPILLLGIFSHSLGMFHKHRLEQGQFVRMAWVQALYWICWLALVALLLYILMRQL